MELATKDTAMFEGDGTENTLVATGLTAATVRVEIDVPDRLSDTEAAADKRIAIGVDGRDERGVRWIEANHRRRVAEMRLGSVQALEQRNQTNVRSNSLFDLSHFRKEICPI